MNLLSLDPAGGGVTTYALELAGALHARSDIRLEVLATAEVERLLRARFGHQTPPVSQLRSARRARLRYAATLFGGVPIAARRLGVDVLHSPTNFGPARAFGIPCVATVHDVIWAQVGEDWGSAAAIREMRLLSRATVPRMRRVITDSEASRAEIMRVLGVEASRIEVIPLGVAAVEGAQDPPGDIRERLGIGPGEIVLCVAQKRPYKGHADLIRAVARVPTPVQLVLPGAPTPYEAVLRDLARSCGIADRVQFPAWLEQQELDALYRAATCVVLPSSIEGFGLPALEAMARSVPVACSGVGALAEASGSAALHFAPLDVDAIAAAISTLVDDESARRQLVHAGRARAAEFTWARTAELTVAAYRRAIG
ncbi:MAG: glycosyltransferase family 4 protein [Gaiellales bacterium]